jgi:hypothetical protein
VESIDFIEVKIICKELKIKKGGEGVSCSCGFGRRWLMTDGAERKLGGVEGLGAVYCFGSAGQNAMGYADNEIADVLVSGE